MSAEDFTIVNLSWLVDVVPNVRSYLLTVVLLLSIGVMRYDVTISLIVIPVARDVLERHLLLNPITFLSLHLDVPDLLLSSSCWSLWGWLGQATSLRVKRSTTVGLIIHLEMGSAVGPLFHYPSLSHSLDSILPSESLFLLDSLTDGLIHELVGLIE